MEDSNMHRKETKLLNKTPNVSFHRNTPCGVDQEIHNICPLHFLHLMLHINFVRISIKVYKKKQNRSTNNQDCEYTVLWYTINVLMRRKSCFMQMNFIKSLSQCIFSQHLHKQIWILNPIKYVIRSRSSSMYLYIIHTCINYKQTSTMVFDLSSFERISIVQ